MDAVKQRMKLHLRNTLQREIRLGSHTCKGR